MASGARWRADPGTTVGPVFGSRSAVLGGVAGAVVGSVVALALVLGGALDGRVTRAPGADVSAEFLAAYQRSLEGTYVVLADFTRRLDSGATLTSSAMVAQRPPDVDPPAVRRPLGHDPAVSRGLHHRGGRHLPLQPGCRRAPLRGDGADLGGDDDLLLHRHARRSIGPCATGADCFELIQNRPSAVLPYGSQARFCFDEATGAVRC